jgi:hypothetical protein
MTRAGNYRNFRSDLDRKLAIDRVTTFARSGPDEPSQLDVFEYHSRSMRASSDTSVISHVIFALIIGVTLLVAAYFLIFPSDFYATKDLIKSTF